MASFKKYSTKNKGELWLFKVDLGIDPSNGKRINTTRRGYKTKKEAQLAAAEIERQRENGSLLIERQDVLIKEFLVEWLLVYKKGKIRDNTYKLHERNVYNKLIPHLGYYKLTEITSGFYQKFINDMADKHNTKRTVEIINTTMSNAMNKAIDLGIINKNPCARVSIPDKNVNKISDKKKIGYLTKLEVVRFLEAALSIHWKYYILFKLLIDTGLRKGEALSLQINDINFKEKKINVNKTLVYESISLSISEMFAPPKTDSSIRELLIPDNLIKELKKQISFRNQNILLSEGTFRTETNLLFDRGDGNPFAKSTIQRAFKKICAKAEINHSITVHGLRHTHAVLMLEAGASMKEVQERLGHKSIDITADVYSHITNIIEQRSIENYSSYMNYTVK